MALWTEYEGTTIGSGFPLTKLLLPEGRSALFSTLDEKGSVKILRLIESHFDDEEILVRWKGVAALKHPHLLRIEDYGRVSLDETILVYAVMEPSDANLGEVLVNQRLSPEESSQLAESIASALDALHSHGFVHEHVEPKSILAVGEVVKLRSDCIREAPEGAEGKALKQRDIQGLCNVLLRALTQSSTLEGVGKLPAPFDRILPRGLRGELGAAEILAAFRPAPVVPASVAAAPAVPAPAASSVSTVPAPAVPRAAVPASEPARKAPVAPAKPAPAKPAAVEPESAYASRSTSRSTVAAVSAFVIVLCGWLVWHLLHRSPEAAGQAAPAVVVQQAAAVAPSPAQASVAQQPKTTPVPAPVAKPIAADTREGWRVIAFTYNHEDQARHKAEVVGQQHPDLQPDVYSPTGSAPYLVSLGGVMNQEQAFAFAAKAHREGMPHDVFARHYHGR